jgi:circadian clock protein KaiB
VFDEATERAAPDSHAEERRERPERTVLTLFVAERASSSARARRQIEAWLAGQVAGDVDLTVVNVHDRPELAEQERILATPTLVRHHPLPRRKIVGDLSDWESVAHGLDLKEAGLR